MYYVHGNEREQESLFKELFIKSMFLMQMRGTLACALLTSATGPIVSSRGAIRAALVPATPATLAWQQDAAAETVVPNVSLTRSRDGTTGTATFLFETPRCLHDVWSNELITGLWLRDEEGELVARDLSLGFNKKGRPNDVKAVLVLKDDQEWTRFIRFMDRFAAANDLGFNKAAAADASASQYQVAGGGGDNDSETPARAFGEIRGARLHASKCAAGPARPGREVRHHETAR